MTKRTSILLAYAYSMAFILLLPACQDIIPVKRFKIPQNGMYPTLPAGSIIWAKKNPYKSVSDIQRGDIVIFKMMKDEKQYSFIWRVIALPGEHVNINNSQVRINGRILPQRKLREDVDFAIFAEANGNVEYHVALQKKGTRDRSKEYDGKVPDGEIFLLGDNRSNAWDSRYHGTVKMSEIQGKVMEK